MKATSRCDSATTWALPGVSVVSKSCS
jgi:hypothetical protein